MVGSGELEVLACRNFRERPVKSLQATFPAFGKLLFYLMQGLANSAGKELESALLLLQDDQQEVGGEELILFHLLP